MFNSFARFGSRIMKALTAFRSAYMATDAQNAAYSKYEARAIRYEMLFAYYDATPYSDAHTWATKLRSEYGLYHFVRPVLNPAKRLGDFWVAHIWGGDLDRKAGDGLTTPSAIPLVNLKTESIRPMIAQVWQWSNWRFRKDVATLWGAVLGDVFLRVSDDPGKKRVTLEVVHPSQVVDVDVDAYGNIKGYRIEYTRPDDVDGRQNVTYAEQASRTGTEVLYETFKNDRPYDWSGNGTAWSVAYGFVPMVHIKHIDIGQDFGVSELQNGLAKFREVDDLSSKLTDQVRKSVDAGWLFSGVSEPDDEEPSTEPDETRSQELVLYAPQGASATPLVASVDVGAVTAYIESLMQGIEKDFPELRADLTNFTGEISGVALRTSRRFAEQKVYQRRAAYDDGLVRVQMMALSIGKMQGYTEFAALPDNAFESGALYHEVGPRAAFILDPQEKIDLDLALFDAADKAVSLGIDLPTYLLRSGWKKEDIKAIQESPAYVAKMKAIEMATNPIQEPPENNDQRFKNIEADDGEEPAQESS